MNFYYKIFHKIYTRYNKNNNNIIIFHNCMNFMKYLDF